MRLGLGKGGEKGKPTAKQFIENIVDIYQLTLPGINNRELKDDTAINKRLLELIGYEGGVLNSLANNRNK